ncbi:hypothetical protein T459_35464 [Capsicum annuum]|uniref:GDSL esterase/lipase At5g03980-like n=1 Tax=Capsicum annuum TaxID=4072 RepID=A0A2G2XJB4_CAPAN|nr:hypothetical protein T459_35464 [Capsicum annuum]
MSSLFKSNCLPEKSKKSLVLVGEIGGNEFNYGLAQGKTIEELRKMVPDVVQTIIHGVKEVIGFGATRIIIPGNFPIGCVPAMLTHFLTNNSNAYDEYHCLKDLNNFATFYNHHLQQAIDELNKNYPNVTLIYGDYYNAFLWLLKNAASLGFDKNSLQKVCCGIGGEYNYDLIKVDAQKFQESGLKKCRFDRIYQFGDSLSDTGNCLRESLCGANSACRRLPYGMNVFKKATGRSAESGLPLLNPYEDGKANFSHGANFAVAGATALSAEFLAKSYVLHK